MKFHGVTPDFKCALAGSPGHACSPERARWPDKGYWSDVCQAAMDAWQSNLNKQTRNPWTGAQKQGGK